MNIAFQALLFLLLLLPGFIFLSAYNGKITKDQHIPLTFPSFSTRGVLAVVAATLLHLLWVVLCNGLGALIGYSVDLETVFFLLLGSYRESARTDAAVTAMAAYAPLIALYFLSLYAAAVLAGHWLSRLVRQQRWDIRHHWLRYANDWHYLFNGEILSFPETTAEPAAVAGTFVSATVELGGKPFLFVGVLMDYWLGPDGRLDRLLLSHVWRRELSRDREPDAEAAPIAADPRYYEIEGDYFVLYCSELDTLNIQYVVVEPA